MLRVHKISLKPSLPVMQSVNVFLVEGEKPILIDSGYEKSVDQLSAEIGKLGFKLDGISMIVNTHEHMNHFGGNALIKERSNAEIAAHEIAVPLIEDMKNQFPSEDELKEMPDIIIEYAKARSAIYEKVKTAKIDIKLRDGDVINMDEYWLEVLHTPGHTHGHICLYERRSRTLFAGDLITERGTPSWGACVEI